MAVIICRVKNFDKIILGVNFMIDGNAELFTASEAEDAGLLDAIKKGTAKVEGRYTITPEGKLKFRQQVFTFSDKFGNWSFGKFVTDDELLKFGGYEL